MDSETYFWIKIGSMGLAFIIAMTVIIMSYDALETKQFLDHGFVRKPVAGSTGVYWVKPEECK